MVRFLGRAFLALAALDSCTDAGLQPHTEDVEKVDDQLEVAGQYCTDAPDEVAFPVKLLIALDSRRRSVHPDPPAGSTPFGGRHLVMRSRTSEFSRSSGS
jgi:hypothetical protein